MFLAISKFTEGHCQYWRTVLLWISNSTYFWYGRCFLPFCCI